MPFGRQDRPIRPIPALAQSGRPAPEPAGDWAKDGFRFKSPQHEQDWRRQAYRQSVRPEGWHTQLPVDHRTQAVLDTMPEAGDGQYFRGPDGKHRRVTMDLREESEVQQIRRRAFNDFANTGVTWEQLGAYDPDQPHPGEDEAVALSQAKAWATVADSAPAGPNKTRDMGMQPKSGDAITQVAGDLDLGLGQLADPWDGGSAVTAPPAVLVAGPYQAVGAMPGLKGPVGEPRFGVPKKPTPTQQARRDFVEGLVGRPANDNTKPAASSNIATSPADSKLAGQAQPPLSVKPITGASMSAEDVAEAEYLNGLFNWQRQGKPAPEPKAYAIHAISDEGRFSYLEDMKDEWSRLVEAHPEEIFKSMTSEVEKLSHAAQQDFFTAYHRVPNATELAEINDAVEKVVFAPAEHWGSDAKGPNHRGDQKPYLSIEPTPQVLASEAFSIVDDVLNTAVEASKKTGKVGNETTQRHVPELAQRMIEELKRCGIDVNKEQRKYEKQIKITRSNKGARWSDFRIEFEVDGKKFALDVNHAAYMLSRYSRTPGEQAAFTDIVSFRRINANGGEFADSEGAVISFPKIRKKQTEEDYLKQMDDFLKNLIDCRSPVKVRVTDPYDVQIIRRTPKGVANDK